MINYTPNVSEELQDLVVADAVDNEPGHKLNEFVGYGGPIGTVADLIEVLQKLPPDAGVTGELDEPVILLHYRAARLEGYEFVVIRTLT